MKLYLILLILLLFAACKPCEVITETRFETDTLIVIKGGEAVGLVPCGDTVFTERVIRDSTGRVELRFIRTGDGIIAKCTITDTMVVVKKVREVRFVDRPQAKAKAGIPAWRWVLAGASGGILIVGLFWIGFKVGRWIIKINTGI